MPPPAHLLQTLFVVAILSGCGWASPATTERARTFPSDGSRETLPTLVCSTGTSTVLELSGVTRSVRHDGAHGRALFTLKDRNDGRLLWKNELVGEGVCFGFNSHKRIHIIGARREHGIGVRLAELRYVDEVARADRSSVFDKRRLEAFAAVPGPGLRHLALIAFDRDDVALLVLDVESDTIRKLGRAPLPPPLTATERKFVTEHPEVLEGKWGWMASFRDGFMELDPGIVVFEGDARLRVSYGDDTPYERRQERDAVVWDVGREEPSIVSPSPDRSPGGR